MLYKKSEEAGKPYIESVIGETRIDSERDILDFIVHCGEHKTSRVLLHEENISEDFFDLKTRLAGDILQKLATYSVKAAIVISEKRNTGRFGEFVSETRKSGTLRFFNEKDDAAEWLKKD